MKRRLCLYSSTIVFIHHTAACEHHPLCGCENEIWLLVQSMFIYHKQPLNWVYSCIRTETCVQRCVFVFVTDPKSSHVALFVLFLRFLFFSLLSVCSWCGVLHCQDKHHFSLKFEICNRAAKDEFHVPVRAPCVFALTSYVTMPPVNMVCSQSEDCRSLQGEDELKWSLTGL